MNELYRSNGFVRTQHQVSNVTIEKTGQDTATVRAYLIAVHAFPDERVFFATGKYVDVVERVNEQWKIVHRDEPITSCALLEAFPVGEGAEKPGSDSSQAGFYPNAVRHGKPTLSSVPV